MKFRLAAAIAALFWCAIGAAQARPQFVAVLTQTYPTYAAALQKRSCLNCHVSMSNLQRNAYGKEIQDAMTAAGANQLTPAIVHQVENMDAAGDGVSNLTRIEKGLPPAGAPGGAAGPNAPASAPAKQGVNPAEWAWIPKNGFHPAIVHFPIALFIAGVFLDFLGYIRRDKTLLFAGWYNLVLGALSALAACATGVIAIWLQQIPVSGLIRTHLTLGILATVIMWVLVGMRVHRHEKIGAGGRAVYYVLAAINLCVISYAGHLGGMFVYGS